jgi:hypothetical protein
VAEEDVSPAEIDNGQDEQREADRIATFHEKSSGEDEKRQNVEKCPTGANLTLWSQASSVVNQLNCELRVTGVR